MSLTLDAQLEALVRQKVASGRYHDENEVLREALDLLDERDQLETLRAKIAIGAEEAERGELIPYSPGLLEELRREAKQLAAQGQRPDLDVCP